MSISSIIFNGNVVPSNQTCIKANDRGFTLGHGLFETILVKKRSFPALDYHWKRLEASAEIVGIVIPFSRSELEQMILQLIEKNALQDKLAGARLTLTSGESERGILPSSHIKPNYVISVFEVMRSAHNEYSAVIVSIKKNQYAVSSRIKSTSYLDNILAKQEAVKLGYDEAILLNTSANVADGAISNIYMVKDTKIITPPISDGALPGVVRRMLLEEFSHEFPIIERSIAVPDLLNADEVFITNALMGVKSLTRLNMKEFNTFSVTHRIANGLFERKNY